MRFDIITIFPDMIRSGIAESIMKRAQAKKKVEIKVHNLRDYSKDKHKTVDDRPYGGGAGMVLMCEPIFDAVKKIKGRKRAKVILMCPTGVPLSQRLAKELTKEKNLIIICGHYEGVDERIRTEIVDESISIGDYILTGGELPALVLMDCISRLIPGVLGKEESLQYESFEGDLLDFPQYTRPADFRGVKVPDVLLSGHHKDIEAWRHQQSVELTKNKRPDLIRRKNNK